MSEITVHDALGGERGKICIEGEGRRRRGIITEWKAKKSKKKKTSLSRKRREASTNPY